MPIIQHNASKEEPIRWQALLAHAVTDLFELFDILHLDPHAPDAPVWDKDYLDRSFSLRVPRGFVARMQKGSWTDPLLLQVLPQAIEYGMKAGFSSLDPLGENDALRMKGLLQKYKHRVLVMPTGACAIHCRYCFRRHFPYAHHKLDDEVFKVIASDPGIQEVIFSGGDPLLVSDDRWALYFERLACMMHIKRVRIHTRLPIVLPERITSDFIACLTRHGFKAVVVLHCNHPNEVDQQVQAVCLHMRQSGILLLNQSVLLRGINDNVDSLVALSERLFDAGVLPYYLHHLDPVQGCGHFEIKTDRAAHLMRAVSARLPGYLVPKWVKEVPGESAKQVLAYHGF